MCNYENVHEHEYWFEQWKLLSSLLMRHFVENGCVSTFFHYTLTVLSFSTPLFNPQRLRQFTLSLPPLPFSDTVDEDGASASEKFQERPIYNETLRIKSIQRGQGGRYYCKADQRGGGGCHQVHPRRCAM